MEIELSNFSVVLLSVFLEDDIILLFLFACDSPLFEFLLVPVEFELNLFDFFIGPENSYLDVIESLLIFGDDFVMFFYLIFETAALSFGDLPEMILSLGFFIFLVDKAFRVEEFLIDVSKMFLKNFFSLEISLIFLVDFFDDSALFFDELVEFFVFVIGEFRDVVLIFGILADRFSLFILEVLLVLFFFILFFFVVVIVVF